MKREHHPETLRVDRDLALREAGKAFDRGDIDAEVMHYEKARQISQDIYHAETRYERRGEVVMNSGRGS